MTSAFQALAAAVGSACGVPEVLAPRGPIDWDEVVRLVDRHRVAALVKRSGWLRRAGAPAETITALTARERYGAIVALRALAVQREALATLAATGIEALVLKGAAVAIDGHGDAGARGPSDVDLLIAPDAVASAVTALRAAGFGWYGWWSPEDSDRAGAGPEALAHLPELPMLRDVTLERHGVQVELHWKLFANTRLMPVSPDWLREPRVVEAGGHPFPTLPLEAHWLYVLMHGTTHLWSWMKWLADVPALALRHPELVSVDRLEATDRAHWRTAATGLIVAEKVFGPFLTPATRAWAADVRGTRLLVRRSLDAVTADLDRPHLVTPRALPAEVAGRLALRADARYRLEELQLLLLGAGRGQAAASPGVAELISGPPRWVLRSARRASAAWASKKRG